MGEGKRKWKTALKEKLKKRVLLVETASRAVRALCEKSRYLMNGQKLSDSVTEKNIKQNPNPLSLMVLRLLMLQVSTLSIKL